MADHRRWMVKALHGAEDALDAGERPVGAVVVWNEQIIGRGRNRVAQLNDPTAHAVLLAITAASETLGRTSLPECTIYATVEPCPMCAGAIVSARLDRLVFGAFDEQAGAVSSLYAIPRDDRLGPQVSIVSGVHSERASTLLQEYLRAQESSG